MKKVILHVIACLALMFVSCQHESDPASIEGGDPNTFNIQVEIDNIGSGLQVDTRAIIVDPQVGEDQVNHLYLLFFKKAANGSTSYQSYLKVNGPISVGSSFGVNYKELNAGNYSILAFANIDNYFPNSPSLEANALDNFLDNLNPSMSEDEVTQATTIYLGHVASGYTDQLIVRNNLIMSGRTQKADGQQSVTLKLTRGVCRFDAQTLDVNYDLASVSIWNNASVTPLWLTANAPKATVNPGRFYGVQLAAGSREVKGELYAFENHIPDPAIGDKATTCLVIGLQPTGGGSVQYYRVNIHPEESGQSIKRNYVYQVSVRAVLGAGASTEKEAYESTATPKLDIDINNWNLDDEGMILTDGKNTLAIPSKIIRFAKEGGTRKYTIFTQGEGTVTMSSTLPSGLSASLNKNELTVKADDLGSLTRRDGILEISFAGLKGTLQVIQEPKELHYLRVDKSTLTGFPATKGGTYGESSVNITSSKEWSAKIYNTGGSNFSFNQNNSTALTTTGAPGDDLNIYITEDNTTNNILTGFVLISLQNEPGYNRVVMLKQSKSSGISIDLGTLSALPFKASGAPKEMPNSIPGDPYTFEVDPGTDMGGNANEWNAVLTGTDADKFNLSVEKSQSTNRFSIYPKGNTSNGTPSAQYPYRNLTLNPIDGVELKVYWGDNLSAVENDPAKCIKLPVYQEALVFATSGITIAKTGEQKDIQVSISEGFTWKATIKSNWTTAPKYANMEHKGYMLNGNTRLTDVNASITGQSTSKIKVGFDKLLFPIVNVNPILEIVVMVEQSTDILQVIEVKQEKLIPNPVHIGDIDGTPAYGRIMVNCCSTGYRNFVTSSALFGPNASSKCYLYNDITFTNITKLVPKNMTTIPEHINYVHAATSKHEGSPDNRWSSITYSTVNDWRIKNEGIVVYVQDESSSYSHKFFNNAPFNGSLYTESTKRYSNRMIDSNNSNIMKYLLSDGPFGDVNTAYGSKLGHIDGLHTAVTKASVLAAGGIPVVTESTNTNNVLVFINPKEKMVFIGETQLFDCGFSTNGMNASEPGKSNNRFLANLISYIFRAAQYGSHFTDHFVDNSNTYPFNKLKTTYPEPMF